VYKTAHCEKQLLPLGKLAISAQKQAEVIAANASHNYCIALTKGRDKVKFEDGYFRLPNRGQQKSKTSQIQAIKLKRADDDS